MQKSRLPAIRNAYNILGVWICLNTGKAFNQSQQSGLLGKGAWKQRDSYQNILKDAEIAFSETNSVWIIRGIYIIQACNFILELTPNAIINPKKA